MLGVMNFLIIDRWTMKERKKDKGVISSLAVAGWLRAQTEVN